MVQGGECRRGRSIPPGATRPSVSMDRVRKESERNEHSKTKTQNGTAWHGAHNRAPAPKHVPSIVGRVHLHSKLPGRGDHEVSHVADADTHQTVAASLVWVANNATWSGCGGSARRRDWVTSVPQCYHAFCWAPLQLCREVRQRWVTTRVCPTTTTTNTNNKRVTNQQAPLHECTWIQPQLDKWHALGWRLQLLEETPEATSTRARACASMAT